MEWFTRTYRVSSRASICVPIGKKNVSCAAVLRITGHGGRHVPLAHSYIRGILVCMLESIGDLGEDPLFGRGVWTAIHDNRDERLGHGPLQRLYSS